MVADRNRDQRAGLPHRRLDRSHVREQRAVRQEVRTTRQLFQCGTDCNLEQLLLGSEVAVGAPRPHGETGCGLDVGDRGSIEAPASEALERGRADAGSRAAVRALLAGGVHKRTLAGRP